MKYAQYHRPIHSFICSAKKGWVGLIAFQLFDHRCRKCLHFLGYKIDIKTGQEYFSYYSLNENIRTLLFSSSQHASTNEIGCGRWQSAACSCLHCKLIYIVLYTHWSISFQSISDLFGQQFVLDNGWISRDRDGRETHIKNNPQRKRRFGRSFDRVGWIWKLPKEVVLSFRGVSICGHTPSSKSAGKKFSFVDEAFW